MTSCERATVSNMAVDKLRLGSLRLIKLTNSNNVYNAPLQRLYCTVQSKDEKDSSKQQGSFVKFLDKEQRIKEELSAPPKKNEQTFASLLRQSKFIDMGNPKNKVVIGKIYHIVGDDLYIDFGWKFHAVCAKPPKNSEFYGLGTKVKLLIKDLELSSKFLGSSKEITLLEADCVLLGLADPKRSNS